ncbi:MAG: hypothetical protein IBX56_20070 [Methylomicrobium sp.]|nr:hypothetical protein [Methylomicrobium sp.]
MNNEKPTLFLKSIDHIRVSDTEVNHLRSLFVGTQFIFHLPYEIMASAIVPMFVGIWLNIYQVIEVVTHLVFAAFYATSAALCGHLFAAEEALEHDED